MIRIRPPLLPGAGCEPVGGDLPHYRGDEPVPGGGVLGAALTER